MRLITDDPRLTPREREVLTLIAEGENGRGVAEILSITTDTARTHIKNIRVALCVRTMAEAVAVVLRRQQELADAMRDLMRAAS